jgi:cytochrome c peroxidase
MGKFRTPTLRNIAKTAPYMHDGSIPDLATVIRSHYAKAGRSESSVGGVNPLRSKFMVGFEVSNEEVRDLVAFLEALTDDSFLSRLSYSNPWVK